MVKFEGEVVEVKERLHIAVDGPAAAGKGTLSKILAQRLGLLYIYTGAMYRAVALEAFRQKVAWDDEKTLVELIKRMRIELRKPEIEGRPQNHAVQGRLVTVLVNGEDVSEAITSEKIGRGSSDVAVLPKVRALLVKRQQELARDRSVVMEGRDIGTVVLPRADLKIYLTASLEERAKRRFRELKERGQSPTKSQVLADMKERDRQDLSREADPLTKAEDAWLLDTTKLSIEQVVEEVMRELKKRSLIDGEA